MAAPHHPSILPSGVGKALALVPGGGQPIHLLQNPNQSLTMVRVVTSGPLTSNPPNGYSNPSVGGGDGNSELRGTAMWMSVRSAGHTPCIVFHFLQHYEDYRNCVGLLMRQMHVFFVSLFFFFLEFSSHQISKWTSWTQIYYQYKHMDIFWKTRRYSFQWNINCKILCSCLTNQSIQL